MKKYIFDKKGQTLLEALIALSILVIILGAVATSVLTSINNVSFVKQQNQANKLAQQGIEYIRDRINNSGINSFSTYTQYAGGSGIQCFNDINVVPMFVPGYCPSANIQGFFKREATFGSARCDSDNLPANAHEITVTVNVYWTDGKCTTGSFCHSQKVTSCFIDPAQSLPAGGQSGI